MYTYCIGKYPIFLEIHKNENKISGKYQYKGHTNFMSFSGEINSDGIFTINEYNGYEQVFGIFKGKLDFETQRMSGVWENKDGTKQLEFEVRRK